MRNYMKGFLPLSLVLLLLAGCTADNQGGSGTSDIQSPETSGRSFRVEQTVSLTVDEPDTGSPDKHVCSGTYGSTLYLLAVCQREEEPGFDMWLYTFQMDTRDIRKTPFGMEIPDLEQLYVDAMFVTGEGEITLRIYGVQEGGEPSSFLCRTDLTGTPLDEDNPFSEDSEYPPKSGRFCAGPDGSSLYTQTENQNTDILCSKGGERSPAVLTSLEGFVDALCSDEQGGLYYILNGSELWYRSPDGQVTERLLSLNGAGIDLTMDSHLLTDGQGGIAVCAVGQEGSEIYLLTEGEVSGQPESAEYETIRLTSLTPFYYIPLLELAQDWAVGSDRYRILIETEKEDAQALEALRTKTLADITAKKGPEILLVSKDDMYMLAEKGAICDLSEVVPEEIQEQFVPCIRDMGTVDGAWVGLPGSLLTINTLCTSDILWKEDNWTVSDVLDIADTRDDWDWVLGFHDAYGKDIPQSKLGSHHLFQVLFGRCLGDSPFLDVEKGVSYFNGEEFIRVLEFCKRYGQNPNQKSREEVDQMLEDGDLIAMEVYFYGGLHDYSEMMASASGCHAVGYPDEKGNGNYVDSGSYLVVNAGAAGSEAVRDCIAFLFSYENELYNANSSRMDVIRDQVVSGSESPFEKPVIRLKEDRALDGYSYMMLDLKPDGSSYLEEYCAFLENCEPKPFCPQAITDILEEEIDVFFAGERSAKETAELIQNRVQLYFDEQ